MAKPKTVKRRKKEDIPERDKPAPKIPTRKPDKETKVERAGVIPFTPEQADECAKGLVTAVLDLKKLKADQKADAKKWKEKREAAEEEVIRLAEKHDKGGHQGTIRCKRELYYEESVVVDKNIDTGEVEEVREMEVHEKQLTTPGSDGPPDKPPKPSTPKKPEVKKQ